MTEYYQKIKWYQHKLFKQHLQNENFYPRVDNFTHALHVMHVTNIMSAGYMNIHSSWQSSIRWMNCCQHSASELGCDCCDGNICCILLTFLSLVFSNESSNGLPERMYSHTGYIGVKILQECCDGNICAKGVKKKLYQYEAFVWQKILYTYLHYPTKFCKKVGCNCYDGNICATGMKPHLIGCMLCNDNFTKFPKCTQLYQMDSCRFAKSRTLRHAMVHHLS